MTGETANTGRGKLHIMPVTKSGTALRNGFQLSVMPCLLDVGDVNSTVYVYV